MVWKWKKETLAHTHKQQYITQSVSAIGSSGGNVRSKSPCVIVIIFLYTQTNIRSYLCFSTIIIWIILFSVFAHFSFPLWYLFSSYFMNIGPSIYSYFNCLLFVRSLVCSLCWCVCRCLWLIFCLTSNEFNWICEQLNMKQKRKNTPD